MLPPMLLISAPAMPAPPGEVPPEETFVPPLASTPPAPDVADTVVPPLPLPA